MPRASHNSHHACRQGPHPLQGGKAQRLLQAFQIHGRRHAIASAVVHRRGLGNRLAGYPVQLLRVPREGRVMRLLEEELQHLGDLRQLQGSLVEQVESLLQRSPLADAVYQGRVRKPPVPAPVHLLRLPLQVVQDVQGQLELLVDPVVVRDGGVLVRGEPYHHESIEGAGERPELVDQPILVPLRAGPAGVRGRQAVRHNRQHEPPAARDLALQTAAQLLKPRRNGRDAAGAVAPQDIGQPCHLLLGAPGAGVHDDEVPTLLQVLGAGWVQQQELAPHARAGVPLGVRHGHGADLVPPGRRRGLVLRTVSLQHVAVRLAGRARVVQKEHTQCQVWVLMREHVGQPPGSVHGPVGRYPLLVLGVNLVAQLAHTQEGGLHLGLRKVHSGVQLALYVIDGADAGLVMLPRCSHGASWEWAYPLCVVGAA
mmetsp:Transcript_64904/g.201054  ORF Transcript_64904/g.201054 Transcript_64904/m.201054 type:complete len:426 (+) Transcript_64904:115-1392(+)